MLLIFINKLIFNKYKCFSLELLIEELNVGVFNLDLINIKIFIVIVFRIFKNYLILYKVKGNFKRG